jgi:hypothetical protein
MLEDTPMRQPGEMQHAEDLSGEHGVDHWEEEAWSLEQTLEENEGFQDGVEVERSLASGRPGEEHSYREEIPSVRRAIRFSVTLLLSALRTPVDQLHYSS